MSEFTVITWANEKYYYLVEGLEEDCNRLGYDFKCYKIDADYNNMNAAWNMHPRVIKQGVETFGKVLFLDCECRILKALPESLLSEPFISVRNPDQHFWIKYNSGTVYADRSCLGWLDTWIHILSKWRLDKMPDDAYIFYPNDICDELPLHAALLAHRFEIKEVKLEYVDKTAKHPIARGYWRNDATLIQHPTLHHWQSCHDPIIAKKLFYQNCSQRELDQYDQYFLEREDTIEIDGWWFDFKQKRYAPLMYPDHQLEWASQKVMITAQER